MKPEFDYDNARFRTVVICDDMYEAHDMFCRRHTCNECPLQDKRIPGPFPCATWCVHNPVEAAELMGFEILV